jgi:hypothetical protein
MHLRHRIVLFTLLAGFAGCPDNPGDSNSAQMDVGSNNSTATIGSSDDNGATGVAETSDGSTSTRGGSQTSDPETGTSETGTSETGTSETGTSETGTSETGTAETGTSETDGGTENPCQSAGGICLFSAENCTDGGGSLLADGDAGCVFDDIEPGLMGVCCEPPTASAPNAGDSCSDRGGLCTSFSGCALVDGAFTAADPGCGFAPCCVPETVCGFEDVECCEDPEEASSAAYRASCDWGTITCSFLPETTLAPIGTCGN